MLIREEGRKKGGAGGRGKEEKEEDYHDKDHYKSSGQRPDSELLNPGSHTW